jgi:glycosyltransferase involved in cell wall biosynthesis
MLLDNDFTADPRVQNEARALADGGHEVIIICLRHNNIPAFEIKDGIRVHRLYFPKLLKNILFSANTMIPFYFWVWYLWGIRVVRKYNIQVIHAHDLYMAIPAYWIKKKTGIPALADLHENYPAAFKAYAWIKKTPHKYIIRQKYWENNEGNILNNCDAIITLSNHFQTTLQNKYPYLKNKTWIEYPNVPDVSKLLSCPVKHDEYAYLKNAFWVFYFGIISDRRGINTLIDSIEYIKNNDIKLLLVGPVDKHEITSFHVRFERLKSSGRLLHYNWKNMEELPSLLYYSSVCVSPIKKNDQHESGVANKVFQYMLFEKPLVVSNCSPQVEIVTTTNCGLWYEDGNLTDLSEKINFLFQNPNECKIMGQNGKKAVIDKYNTTHYSKKIIEYYNSMINDSNCKNE